jgi:hypothetical protein
MTQRKRNSVERQEAYEKAERKKRKKIKEQNDVGGKKRKQQECR